MRHSVGNYLADTKPAQPHTYKKFTKERPKTTPKRHQNQPKGPPKWTQNCTFRCPGCPLDPTRQERLQNDSKFMAPGASRIPIQLQKSTLEINKDAQNGEQYELDKKIGKYYEKVQKSDPP